jgi:hypothetical protein
LYSVCYGAFILINMNINIGDKIASDDYSAIGILTQISNKLYVVGDFGKVEYDEHNGDWEHYAIWRAKVDSERKLKGGFWKRLLNAL